MILGMQGKEKIHFKTDGTLKTVSSLFRILLMQILPIF